MKTRLFIVALFFTGIKAFAQTDAFVGTWQMEQIGSTPVCVQLKIGTPEKNMLYPSSITIESSGFYGVYEMLLVKKNAWQLAISKNKYAVAEKPFQLNLFYLNGDFSLGRNAKGQPRLTINRFPLKQNIDTVADTPNVVLQRLVNEGNMQFFRINATPWKDAWTKRILSPAISPLYFGLMDTVYLPTRYGSYATSSQNKNDIVTAILNNRFILEQLPLTKKEHSDEVMLDTGSNVIAVFNDYGISNIVSKTKTDFEFGKKKLTLNFNNTADSAASFIAVRLYVMADKDKNNFIASYNYPGPGEPTLQPNEKLIGSIKSVSRQLTLAIWDDAVEDGDSISININGQWVAKALPVKKNPQFINFSLNPGSNTILFVADNVGSIPPNTSVLEIIDGKKRKAFFLETATGEKNLLKIYYDY